MKLRTLLAVAPLALTFALIGMPAASAHSRTTAARGDATYVLCVSGTVYCLAPGIHNEIYAITNFATITSVSFINEYTTPNGNHWWELKTDDGGCLNWSPNNFFVYDDSCVRGDPNELWYNHVAGQLINLGGNEFTGHNTWLSYGACSNGACPLIATNTFFGGWVE